MNKNKKNLETLRGYLGRDTRGLKLLEDIARDITEQRKRIASLEKSEADAVARALRLYRENVNIQVEKEKLETVLELERRRLVVCKAKSAADAERIAQLESDAEPEGIDELTEPTAINDRLVFALFKGLRRRMKRPPKIAMKRTSRMFYVDDIVKKYSGEEYMTLGMFVAVVCLLNGQVGFMQSERYNFNWHEEEQVKGHGRDIIQWMKGWIKFSPLEEKLWSQPGMTPLSGPHIKTR